MFSRYYKLEGQSPVIAESFLDWCLWMASANTRVMVNEIYNVSISTVFLGINLDPQQSEEPMIFETLIMGGVLHGKRNHWATWEQAVQGHLKICAQVHCTFKNRWSESPIPNLSRVPIKVSVTLNPQRTKTCRL